MKYATTQVVGIGDSEVERQAVLVQ
jgi:hypothetical protein